MSKKKKQIRCFVDEESAKTWMFEFLEERGEECIDNYRFRIYGDEKARLEYQKRIEEGCCGSFDEEIQVGDELAEIGCNFGH